MEQRGKILLNSSYTAILVEFIQYANTLGYKPKTRDNMEIMLKQFLGYLQSNKVMSLKEIDEHYITIYIEHLQQRPKFRSSGGLSSEYMKNIVTTLKIFFIWLVKIGGIKNHPVPADITDLIRGHRRSHQALSFEDILKLYGACENWRDKAIMGLFYGCGLRRSEAEKINRNDIDFNRGLLYVRSGKNSKRRTVPITSTVLNHFAEYQRTKKVYHEAFILTEWNDRMSASMLYHRIRELSVKAGLPNKVCLHSLRHSIATHLLENGMDSRYVQQFLGHSSLESTMIYTQISNKIENI